MQIQGDGSDLVFEKGFEIPEWNIISGGPSAQYVQREHLIPNAPILAINGAIKWVERGVPFTHWAVYDDPNTPGIWDAWGKHYHPMIEVWTCRERIAKWKGLGILPEPLLSRTMEVCIECGTAKVTSFLMTALDANPCSRDHKEKFVARGIPAIFAAIERAKDWHGGRTFRFFGVDMKGLDNTAKDNPNYGQHEMRWEYERYLWAHMMKASEADGLTFERVQMVGEGKKKTFPVAR